MKIEQQQPFQPIPITLETVKEATLFRDLMWYHMTTEQTKEFSSLLQNTTKELHIFSGKENK